MDASQSCRVSGFPEFFGPRRVAPGRPARSPPRPCAAYRRPIAALRAADRSTSSSATADGLLSPRDQEFRRPGARRASADRNRLKAVLTRPISVPFQSACIRPQRIRTPSADLLCTATWVPTRFCATLRPLRAHRPTPHWHAGSAAMPHRQGWVALATHHPEARRGPWWVANGNPPYERPGTSRSKDTPC